MTATLAISAAAGVTQAPRMLVLVGPLPPPSGGMANQTAQLARLLEGEGCAVTLVQTNAAYRPAWAGRLRIVRAMFRLVPYLLHLYRATSRADLVHVMANSGWAWHLFTAPAVWIGTLRNVHVVVNYRGGEAREFLARQLRWVRPTLRRARLIVVPSEFLHEVFAAHGFATTIVPNIVDLTAFHPAAELPEAPHLIVTRNLEPIYDIGTAIRAFADIAKSTPAARLTIAGSGPERDALVDLARALGIADKVTFTGRVDNAALPAIYRSASLVLNPSTVDNMPISVLEALASGVPVVSTNVGGIPKMVRDGETALLVNARDPASMARAIRRVLDDRGLREALRSTGLQAVKAHAWMHVGPLWFDAYARARERTQMAGRLTR